MQDLARLQGWLSRLPECPIRIDAQQIPDNFLDACRKRDCTTMDGQACGYCEQIAAQAVSISPEYRTVVLSKYAEMNDVMATGNLWGLTRHERREIAWRMTVQEKTCLCAASHRMIHDGLLPSIRFVHFNPAAYMSGVGLLGITLNAPG
jgi:glutaredoxin